VSDWSLPNLLSSLHDDIERRLATARKAIAHPVSKGDASESIWLELLDNYLPARYRCAKAFVVDSEGAFSEQIDVVIFDRQYSPFIFTFEGQIVVPVESVYAVFEAKQTITAANIAYAQSKAASVRKLKQTSLPIPYAAGVYPAKPPIQILAGVLALDSDWSPPLGQPMFEAIAAGAGPASLDIGCVAAHGSFWANASGAVAVSGQHKPATAFLFELIARLQAAGTVPMIDIRAYAKWLGG
jgi:hypothetical protein